MVEVIKPYAAIFEPTSEGEYSVFFPELPGCVSFGDSMTHAAAMAKEALSLHLSDLEGVTFVNLDDIDLDKELKESEPGSRVVFIEPDFFLMKKYVPGKAQRINITMDEHLIAYADYKAKQSDTNRSQLISEALRQYLGSGLS